MKKSSFLSTSLGAVIMGSIMFSCSEVTKIELEKQMAPIITDFSPKSGKAGTEIKIWGDYLGTVNKVLLGNVESGIKYRLTQDTIIIYPISNSKTGKIKLINPYGETESDEIFTMEYPVPVITSMPTSGEAGDEIMIQGENLNVISEIRFGDIVANITYQSDKEIIVVIPINAPENEKINFYYFDDEGSKYIESDEVFSPTKSEPIFDALSITEANEGSAITITGQNLNFIEKVIMNDDIELNMSKSETSISITLPEVDENTTITLSAIYNGDNKKEIVSGFVIIDVKYYSYKNIMLGARESGLPSFFNATTGASFGACDILGMGSLSENDKFHMYTDYSSSTLIFGNPSNGQNKFKNFKCDGVELETANAKNVVKFYPVENAEYSNSIISGSHESLLTIFSSSANDIVNTLKEDNSSTSDFKYPSWNATDKNVILFVLYNSEQQPEKVGFIHVLSVSETEVTDLSKASYVTFNCYFQK